LKWPRKASVFERLYFQKWDQNKDQSALPLTLKEAKARHLRSGPYVVVLDDVDGKRLVDVAGTQRDVRYLERRKGVANNYAKGLEAPPASLHCVLEAQLNSERVTPKGKSRDLLWASRLFRTTQLPGYIDRVTAIGANSDT
jgi:hypothetical protein